MATRTELLIGILIFGGFFSANQNSESQKESRIQPADENLNPLLGNFRNGQQFQKDKIIVCFFGSNPWLTSTVAQLSRTTEMYFKSRNAEK